MQLSSLQQSPTAHAVHYHGKPAPAGPPAKQVIRGLTRIQIATAAESGVIWASSQRPLLSEGCKAADWTVPRFG